MLIPETKELLKLSSDELTEFLLENSTLQNKANLRQLVRKLLFEIKQKDNYIDMLQQESQVKEAKLIHARDTLNDLIDQTL